MAKKLIIIIEVIKKLRVTNFIMKLAKISFKKIKQKKVAQKNLNKISYKIMKIMKMLKMMLKMINKLIMKSNFNLIINKIMIFNSKNNLPRIKLQ